MEDLIRQIIPMLGEGKRKGSEIIPKYCPFCEGGRHKDKETFAFNTDTGAYNCMRGSCAETGSAYKLAEFLGIRVEKKNDYFREIRKPKKVYKVPEIKSHDLSKEVIDYFKLRGISKETLIKNRVTTDQNGNIVFNYYLDGEIAFVKYKIPRKQRIINGKKERKSWREADTRPILYGMDDCDSKYPLVIFEGEPDKIVGDECGVTNSVSIPSGTQDFTWIDECWDWMQKFREVIIWADNDKAGKAFIQEVMSRLDDWKLKVVKCEDKDANITLHKHGKEKVRWYIENAESVNKEYIVDLADVKRKDYRNQTAIPTGFREIDELLGGNHSGQLIIWTGYNGGGKSTLLSNMILNGIELNHRTFAYSGELAKDEFKEWMDLQLSGRKYLSSYECPIKKKSVPIPNEKYYDLLDYFYREKMFLFDSEDYATDKEVLKAMEYMAKREGIKVFIIDNMLTTPLSGSGDVNEKQAKYVVKLKKFARKFNATVHLVAHPRKPSMGQTRVDKYSISGTANITDLADRVYGVHKLTPRDKEDNPEYEPYSTLFLVFKDRKYGVFDEEVKLKFDYHSKRFYTNSQERDREYFWTKKIVKKNQLGMEGFEEIEDNKPCPWDE